MSSMWDWSKIPGDNDTADSDINWQENQVPSTVNNSARQMMGRVAEFRDDISGALLSTNIGDAYSITTNSAFTTQTDGRVLSFRASASNTGAATLNVNAIGSKAIRYNGSSGDTALSANMIRSGGVYVVRYSTAANGASGAWILQSPSLGTAAFDASLGFTPVQQGGGTGQGTNKVYIGWSGTALKAQVDTTDLGVVSFPAGTRIVFCQAAAPIGWTQVTGIDNRAMRVSDGAGGATGGSVGFTTVFSRTTTDSHVLTTAEIPSHFHGTAIFDPGHDHAVSGGTVGGTTSGIADGSTNGVPQGPAAIDIAPSTTGVRNTSANGLDTTASTGGGGSHWHNIDLRVTYIDVIVCSKD